MQSNNKLYFDNHRILKENVIDSVCKMRANDYSMQYISDKCDLNRKKISKILKDNIDIINKYILELQDELINELIGGKSCNDLSNEYNMSKAKIILLIKEKIGEQKFNEIYRLNKNKKISNKLNNKASEKKIISYNKICKYCGNEFLTEKKYKKCCSQKCANSLRSSLGGRASIAKQTETRRSKNEKLFCELCEQYFLNVEHNKTIFDGWDSDVIIHDIKYAILWNGRWHYEQCNIKHSVKQVQNRDRIKIKKIIEYGYTPYVIKDMGKHNPDFVKEQFDIFIEKINFKTIYK